MRTGGAEKLMVDLLPRFREAGIDVDLLVFDGVDTPFKRQLQEMGVTVFELGKQRNVYHPGNVFKLRPYLSRYDIIHTHNTACQYYVALAKYLFGGKANLITTEHSTDNRRRTIFIFKLLDKWLYRKYASVICVSSKAETQLLCYLKDKGASICTIQNGIDTHYFASAIACDMRRILPQVASDAKIIIQVAAFRPPKDQKTLIRAIARLPEEYHAVFVGDGGCRKECEMLVGELNLENRIHFLGVRTDVAQLLKAADIVVMSSHYEGLSLSSIEGMAVGRPFVASNVNGLREVVEGAGILFEDEDAVQLAGIIKELSADPVLYAEVAGRCSGRAAMFDISTMVARYAEIYHTISGAK